MKPTTEALAAHEARTAADQQAQRLYPRAPKLQAKWLDAIAMVRATTRGYVLDNPITKEQCNAQQN